jgi:hypothetical protein
MLKKFLIASIIGTSILMTGCTRKLEDTVNNYRYTNPRKVNSGYCWTVIQPGTELNHLKCIYWSTNDDDCIFENSSGKKVFVNGTSLIIEE